MLAGLAALVALFTLLWIASLALRNASIVDIWWGPGFVLASLTYLFSTDGFPPRRALVVGLVALWGVRLAWHIGRRNTGQGEDFRYRAWREKYGSIWWWRSYFHVFLLQAVIAWIVGLPVFYAVRAATPAAITVRDVAGVAIFAIGFLFEVVGDEQLRRFRQHAANRGRVMNTGLWRYTRHPNYFGEAVLWWGLGLIGAATPGGAMGLAGPVLITFLLLRVSGVSMLEATLKSSKPGYTEYIASTSSFIPWPRRH